MIIHAYFGLDSIVHKVRYMLFGFTFLVLFSNIAVGYNSDDSSGSEGIVYQQDSFWSVESETGIGWTGWSARESIKPQFFVAALPSLGEAGSLGISGDSIPGSQGCWRKTIEGLSGGHYYNFEASYKVSGISYPMQQARVRLCWLGDDGQGIGRPEYLTEAENREQWRVKSGTLRAPEGTTSVEMQLYLCDAPQGTIWWDNIVLSHVDPPPARQVRVATVNCFPRGKRTARESVEDFLPLLDKAGSSECDIVCLGETVNFVGVEQASYIDVAESIPGPSTRTLGEYAAKYGMYIVASLVESEDRSIYNTAVLIDRQGKIAGKYRKVHLAVPEFEEGITAGRNYPVFDTDFGRIGMMICWDMQFVEPSRALALRGAEMILMPIWGGSTLLPRARAYENQVYLVSSGYGSFPSAIISPEGEIVAEAVDRPSVAFADIDLNKPVVFPWKGNLRNRLACERRLDIKLKNTD